MKLLTFHRREFYLRLDSFHAFDKKMGWYLNESR